MDNDGLACSGNFDLGFAIWAGTRSFLSGKLIADFKPFFATRAGNLNGHKGSFIPERCLCVGLNASDSVPKSSTESR